MEDETELSSCVLDVSPLLTGYGRMSERGHARQGRDTFFEQLELLLSQTFDQADRAGGVLARMGEALDRSTTSRVADPAKDDRDRAGRFREECDGARDSREDQVELESHQFGGQPCEPLVGAVTVADLDREILPFDPAEIVEPADEVVYGRAVPAGRVEVEDADSSDLRRREPRDAHTAARDEPEAGQRETTCQHLAPRDSLAHRPPPGRIAGHHRPRSLSLAWQPVCDSRHSDQLVMAWMPGCPAGSCTPYEPWTEVHVYHRTVATRRGAEPEEWMAGHRPHLDRRATL
ncbi:MAG: hypothetical protein U0893_20975 [Chloroflexota bacterium]